MGDFYTPWPGGLYEPTIAGGRGRILHERCNLDVPEIGAKDHDWKITTCLVRGALRSTKIAIETTIFIGK